MSNPKRRRSAPAPQRVLRPRETTRSIELLRSLIRKPIAWFSLLLLGALAVNLSELMEDYIGDALGRAVGPGLILVGVYENPINHWRLLPANVPPAATAIDAAPDVGISTYEIALVGSSSTNVTIRDMVPLTECTPLVAEATGALVYRTEGDVSAKIALSLDLDAADKVFRRLDESGEVKGPYFSGPDPYKVSLNKNDVESFTIIAKTNGSLCHWSIRIDYVTRGESRSLEVNRNDQIPFGTVAWQPNISNYTGMYSNREPLDPTSDLVKDDLTVYCAQALSGDVVAIPPCTSP